MYYLEFHKKENVHPGTCLDLVEKSIVQLHAAFGAPGNYGYGTKKGDALQTVYAAPDLIIPTREKLNQALLCAVRCINLLIDGDGSPDNPEDLRMMLNAKAAILWALPENFATNKPEKKLEWEPQA